MNSAIKDLLLSDATDISLRTEAESGSLRVEADTSFWTLDASQFLRAEGFFLVYARVGVNQQCLISRRKLRIRVISTNLGAGKRHPGYGNGRVYTNPRSDYRTHPPCLFDVATGALAWPAFRLRRIHCRLRTNLLSIMRGKASFTRLSRRTLTEMSNQTGSTSSNTNGSTPARVLSDPSLTTCPDFSSAAFQAIRLAMDPDDAAAITQLTNSWQQDIDRLKVQWAAQVKADKRTEEAEDARPQDEADQAAADAAKIAEEERLERKLERREYCPLWPFTPAGLKETAEACLSSNDDISALKLSRDEVNQLTVQSGPSSSAHKNMKIGHGNNKLLIVTIYYQNHQCLSPTYLSLLFLLYNEYTNLSDYLHSITDNRRRRVPPTRWLSAWFQELHMFAINHPAFAARLFAQFSSELFHLWTQLDHAVIRQDNTGITEGRSEIQACLESQKQHVLTNKSQRLGSCRQRYNNADAGTRQAMAAAVEFGYAPMQEVEAEVVTVEDFDDMPELVDNFGEDL
ncbi:hypothetical protein B0H13DRAFT_1863093 [Mycena leptocephala]|nr:hypothetical protein B0H13DRAFT_1863093 [Mycena leptocephala]